MINIHNNKSEEEVKFALEQAMKARGRWSGV
jgi:hypothetical protein